MINVITVTIGFQGDAKNYEFAASLNSLESNLTWQKSNVFKLLQEGVYFFFKKDIRNGDIVKAVQVVNCSGEYNCFAVIEDVFRVNACSAYIIGVTLVGINNSTNTFEIVTGTN